MHSITILFSFFESYKLSILKTQFHVCILRTFINFLIHIYLWQLYEAYQHIIKWKRTLQAQKYAEFLDKSPLHTRTL